MHIQKRSYRYPFSASRAGSIDPALVNAFDICKMVSLLILGDAKDAILKYSMGDWNIFRHRIN